jgi:type IV secretory pathway VirB2 component (pilin)
VSLACILLAIAVRLADFDWNRPSAWLFAIVIVVSAAVYALFYFSLERRATRSV